MKLSRLRPRFRPEVFLFEDRLVPTVTITDANPTAYNIPENRTTAAGVQVNYTETNAATTPGLTLTGADAGLFTVGPANAPGSSFMPIVANGTPNFEALPHANPFVIVVQLSDINNNSVATTYNITIQDVVELTGGTVNAVAQQNVNFAENSIGTITTITALGTEAAGTTFAIVGGADAARFTINPATGALSFVNGPFVPELPGQVGRDFERRSDANADGVYQVIIQGNRGGALSGAAFNESRIQVNVTVTDVVENAVTGGQFNPLLLSGNPQGFFPPFVQTNGGAAFFLGAPGPINPIPVIPGSNITAGAGFYTANFAVVGGGAAGATFTFPFLFI